MANPKPFTLTEDEAVAQIVETIRQQDPGTAPFALVLGSGFSHGLVPTARQIVEEVMPLRVRALTGDESYDQLRSRPLAERAVITREFWENFTHKNRTRGLNLTCDGPAGCPRDYPAAYKAAFDPNYAGALGNPAQARKFQRDVMRLARPRLNAAYFLLASLFGLQPDRSSQNPRFKAKAAFSRLILTTNFDPFLQIALQFANRLYFMSDTPELGLGDEVMDDLADAIHLVYLHGSIHRRSQASNDAEIQSLKARNAQSLAPVLKRHGVIVIGYSGWDDVIVEALACCRDFDHRLYWCGLEADPSASGAFGPRVSEILRKPTSNYVQIEGAGHFMAKLHRDLVDGLPYLLANPIEQVRERLSNIDLSEFEAVAGAPSSAGGAIQLPSVADALVRAKQETINRLNEAESFLNSDRQPVQEDAVPPSQPVANTPEAATLAQGWNASAQAALALGNYEEAIKLFRQTCDLATSGIRSRSEALLGIALAHYFSSRQEEAIASWSALIDLPGAPVEQVAQALFNRGVAWGQKGETEKELADYTRVIEQLPGAPVEQVAKALYNRGATWGQKGETEKELADYTRVIEQLPGAPVEQVAKALYNRGVDLGEHGETEKELADYTRVIEQLPGAPVEQVAQALYNRGVAWRQKGETEKELADYTRVIEQLPGAPVEQVAQALYNRGVAWRQKGETEKELADYTRVIEQLPGAPVEQVAQALINRGVVWGQKGETEKELADYTRVIEQLPGAPVEQVATALANRGWVYYLLQELGKFLQDTERALSIKPSIDFAAFNLGLALLANGRDSDAAAAYTRAVAQFPDSVAALALPDLDEAGKTWLTPGRAAPIRQILQPE